MIKVLLSIVIAAFTFTGVAKADAKISGFMQHIIGMGDDIDGGVTDKFSRFAFLQKKAAELRSGYLAMYLKLLIL